MYNKHQQTSTNIISWNAPGCKNHDRGLFWSLQLMKAHMQYTSGRFFRFESWQKGIADHSEDIRRRTNKKNIEQLGLVVAFHSCTSLDSDYSPGGDGFMSAPFETKDGPSFGTNFSLLVSNAQKTTKRSTYHPSLMCLRAREDDIRHSRDFGKVTIRNLPKAYCMVRLDYFSNTATHCYNVGFHPTKPPPKAVRRLCANSIFYEKGQEHVDLSCWWHSSQTNSQTTHQHHVHIFSPGHLKIDIRIDVRDEMRRRWQRSGMAVELKCHATENRF